MRIVDASGSSLSEVASATVGASGLRVFLHQSPPIHAVIEGLGNPVAASRAAGVVIDVVRRKAPLLDKLAAATQSDRTSGARLALVRAIERMIGDVHAELAEVAGREGEPSMAATVVLSVTTTGYAHVAHVGAGRAYLLRDGKLRRLTDDHTIAMMRVQQGLMKPEEVYTSPLRRKLFQALGTGNDIDVDVASIVLADEDTVLLCTEGVHLAVDDANIAAAVGRRPARQAVDALMKRAGNVQGRAVVFKIAADVSPDQIDAIAHMLGKNALFRELTDAERHLVAPYLDRVDLAQGEALFNEGDAGDAFFAIVEGRVRVTRNSTPLTEIGPGGGLGELCLAGPGAMRSATVTALEPTVVLGLTRDRFHEIVARRQKVGSRLLHRALGLIGDRLRDLTERLAHVEALAVGEVAPGDMALRTAIVLAARGEWPLTEPPENQ